MNGIIFYKYLEYSRESKNDIENCIKNLTENKNNTENCIKNSRENKNE